MNNNLTVVVPHYNKPRKSLDRLIATLPSWIPIIIVDDLSDVPLKKNRNWRRNIKVIRPEKKGYFAGAVSVGMRDCETDILILNDDLWLTEDKWLSTILDNREEYGIIGDGVMRHPAHPNGYVQGTLMFIARRVINVIGVMNTRDYPLWGATAEYQLRACRKGFKALPIFPYPGLNHQRGKHENFGDSIKQVLKAHPENKSWYIRTPPMVSVIIAAYNYGRYLPSLINSLIGGETDLGLMPGQTFQSFEVIIVDDGSTDETPEVGKALADDWKGVRYIRRENGGTGAAYNTGIKASYGRYITCMSSDDMMESDRLEKLVRAIEKDSSKVYYDSLYAFKNGKRIRKWPSLPYDFENQLYRNQMHTGIIYTKEAWKKAGGYPEEMVHGREDWAFNIALGIVGYCGERVREKVNGESVPYFGYLYRREGQNRTLTNTDKVWHQNFIRQLKGIFPDIYNGVRPMTCCGRGSGSRTATSRRAPAVDRLAGQDGWVMIEYTGRKLSDMTYYGKISGQKYYIGGIKTTAWIDASDLSQFLDIIEGRVTVFREK